MKELTDPNRGMSSPECQSVLWSSESIKAEKACSEVSPVSLCFIALKILEIIHMSLHAELKLIHRRSISEISRAL